jgi:ComF family protein
MTRQQLLDLAHGISLLIFPNLCWVCSAAEAEGSEFRHGLCRNCHREIAADAHARCPRCAATVGANSDVATGCPACRTARFSFDGAVRLGPYQGRLAEAILRTKSGAGEALAELLGRTIAEEHGASLRAFGADAVVPVPLHWNRRLLRGYNQAESIARELASALHVPIEPQWLRRVKPVVQHLQSSATARRENIKGAFSARRVASAGRKCILLVDDVMTTGSTLSEAARVLKAAGAERVIAVILARR